jgi:hypothetical protein
MKKVWIYIICLFTKLMVRSSLLQLKYFGKMAWINASTINMQPVILRFISIFLKYKICDKWSYFYFLINTKTRTFKRFIPGCF